jgi:EAL domain-containing protein (putative c-di-GMP-specific phosphodiesterase class I)
VVWISWSELHDGARMLRSEESSAPADGLTHGDPPRSGLKAHASMQTFAEFGEVPVADGADIDDVESCPATERLVESSERPSSVPTSRRSAGPFAALRSDPPPNAEGLGAKDIDIVFQPIISVTTRRVFAYEALTRCRWPSLANPETLFRRASEESCCGRLGRLVRAASVQRGSGVPLFVNVHPDELSARWLVRPDDPVFFHDHDVYVEITESAAFTHYDLCVSVLKEIQSRAGIFLAVDDLGAGHSNLKRVLDLEPSIVKLDRALITGLDQSPRQQILVRHVVRLCVELGAQVVAEGIETADELSAVVDSGAHYAQGFLLGRPSYPLPPGRWPTREGV